MCWGNPRGEVLQEVAVDVWCAARPFVWNGVDVGGRAAVVRLPGTGGLLVHSPVALDAPLKAALAELGPVEHVVAPNYEHVKYAASWRAAFPDATLWGCPGLAEKEPDVPVDRELAGDEAPAEWGGAVDVCWFDCEHNPFTRKPFFNEVVFLHAPSGTLVVTDVFWSYPEEGLPLGSRAWKFGMDDIYLPFYKRFMIRDAARFEAAKRRVLGWDFDRVLPCHGLVLQTGGKAAVRAHLS